MDPLLADDAAFDVLYPARARSRLRRFSYELEEVERTGSDWLRAWTKRHDAHDASYFVESDDGSVLRVAPLDGGGHVRIEQAA